MPSTLKHAYMNDISDLYSELSCVRDLSMPMGVTVIREVNKIRGFGRGGGALSQRWESPYPNGACSSIVCVLIFDVLIVQVTYAAFIGFKIVWGISSIRCTYSFFRYNS